MKLTTYTVSPHGRPRTPFLLFAVFLLLLLNACNGTTSQPAITSCDRGELQSGECVNASVCTTDTQCLEHYACYKENGQTEGTCQKEDYCQKHSDCPNGLCDVTQKVCQNYVTCQEHSDCPSQHACTGQVCTPFSILCDRLSCETASKPGVCQPRRSLESCVSKEICENDLQCAGNTYCDTSLNPSTCRPNQCIKGICQSGGECSDRNSGQCSDIPNCQKSQDCTKGKICVKANSENRCVELDKIQETFCKGNQIAQCDDVQCERQPNQGPQKVTCLANNNGCRRRLDCITEEKQQYCKPPTATENATCVDSITCTPDLLEPNNKINEAKKYQETQHTPLTLCNDQDWFSYEVQKEGTLVVTLNIESFDVGNKDVTLELYTTAATTPIASQSIQGEENTIKLTQTITDQNKGEYYIKVSTKETADVQLRYTLHADVVDTAILNLCSPDTLRTVDLTTKSVGGVTLLSFDDDVLLSASQGQQLSTSCAPDATQEISDYVWKLDIEQDSSVLISAISSPTADVVLSLRSHCSLETTELSSSCTDRQTLGQNEELSQFLTRGTYYIVATYKNRIGQGPFRLHVEVEPASCTPADNRCEDVGGVENAIRCNAKGKLETEVCSLGCDATRKVCNKRPGDACGFALPVSTTQPQKGRLDPSTLSNTFHPGRSCTGITSGGTTGNDLLFEVHVPRDHVVIADVKGLGAKSVYISKTCGFDPEAPKCISAKTSTVGKTESAEDYFVWRNKYADQTIYLVIDYSTLTTPSTTFIDYHVRVEPYKCEYGTGLCKANGRESWACNKYGTGYDDYEDCFGYGCNASTGLCNIVLENLCSTTDAPFVARDAADGTYEKNGRFVRVSNTVAQFSRCGNLPVRSLITPPHSPDLFYRIDAKADHSYKITVTPSPSDPVDIQVWLSDSCESGAVKNCIDGIQTVGEKATETLTFFAETDKTYWVVVEPGVDNYNKGGAFNIRVEKTKKQGERFSISQCSGNDLTYINKYGREVPVSCDQCEENLNNEGRCKQTAGNNGDTCLEPIVLYDEHSATKVGSVSIQYFSSLKTSYMTPMDSGQVDRCYFNPNRIPFGLDKYYQFDLKEGDVVAIEDLKTDSPDTVTAFFQEKCGTPHSCLGYVSQLNAQELNYRATKDQTITFVIKKTNASKTGQFNFTWKVFRASDASKKECAPLSTVCKNNQTLSICDKEGSQVTEVTCTCEGDRCIPPSPPTTTSTCGLTQWIVLNDKNSTNPQKRHYMLHFDKTSKSELDVSCTPSAGPEQAFRFYAKKDQVITATSQSVSGPVPSLYVFKEETTCDLNHCLGALGSNDYSKKVPLASAIEEDGWYILVADTEKKETQGFFDVTIEIQNPDAECQGATPLPATCTNPVKGTIEHCSLGVKQIFQCNGGCTTEDSQALCQNPDSSRCFDSQKLYKTPSYSKSPGWSPKSQTSTNIFKPEGKVSGGCMFEYEKNISSEEVWYHIALDKGDLLEVKIEAVYASYHFEDDHTVYITQDCAQPKQSCLASSTISNTSKKRGFSYVAEKTGIYYIGVDSGREPYEAYNLFTRVTPATSSCHPMTGVCKNDNELSYCLSTGEEISITCDKGCVGGTCLPNVDELKNNCPTATLIDSSKTSGNKKGYVVNIPTPLLLNNFGLSHSDLPNGTEGNDAVYKVSLPYNARLRAYLTTTSLDEYGILYVASDCSNAEKSILAAKEYAPSFEGIHSEPLTYANTTEITGQDVYIVVDSAPTKKSQKENFAKRLYIEVDLPDCDPATFDTTCSNTGVVEFCSHDGFRGTYQCPGVTPACTKTGKEVKCSEPSYDFCHDTETYDTFPHTIQGTFANKTNTYPLNERNSCTGFKAHGPDLVYNVVIPAKQTLTATITAAEDVALYLSSSCHDIPNTCVVGSDEFPPKENVSDVQETITYTNPGDTPATMYLHVGSRNPQTSGTFEVKLNVN